MRYILLSADTQPTLYEAPDAVAEALGRWAEAFLDEINRFDSHYWRPIKDGDGREYHSLEYTVADFVDWLNLQPETRHHPVREPALLHMEEREIIMETARKERNLPLYQQTYPWYNF